MRSAHRIGIAIVTAALAAGSGIGNADVPPKQSAATSPVDERLLEFLGSVDSSGDPAQPDDGSWLAYLSQINIGKVATASEPAKPPTPEPAQPKPTRAAAGGNKPGG